MAELMQQEYVEWDDNTFKKQNALEATNIFEATLDAPLNVEQLAVMQCNRRYTRKLPPR